MNVDTYKIYRWAKCRQIRVVYNVFVYSFVIPLHLTFSVRKENECVITRHVQLCLCEIFFFYFFIINEIEGSGIVIKVQKYDYMLVCAIYIGLFCLSKSTLGAQSPNGESTRNSGRRVCCLPKAKNKRELFA